MSHPSTQAVVAGSRLPVLAMLLVAPALFASNMVAARWAHDASLPPVFLAFGRWLVAFCLLLPFVARSLITHRKSILQGLPALLPLALLGMGVAVAPQYIGAQSTSATNIALIFSCSPLMVVALEALSERRAIARHKVLGLLCALGGVLLVITQGRPASIFSLGFGHGDLWVLLAAMGWALYTVLLKKFRLPAIPEATRLGVMMAGGVFALAPFAAIEAYSGHPPVLTDSRLVMTLLFLALVPSLGAYFVYGRLIAQAGSTTASLSMFLVPVFAAAISWPLLGEAPHLFHVFGFALILVGVKFVSSTRASATPGPRLPLIHPQPRLRIMP